MIINIEGKQVEYKNDKYYYLEKVFKTLPELYDFICPRTKLVIKKLVTGQTDGLAFGASGRSDIAPVHAWIHKQCVHNCKAIMFWDGVTWIGIVSGMPGKFTGNIGTVPSDINRYLSIKRFDVERYYGSSAGRN